MTDRRRAVRLISLVVAGLAVAGTTPAPPSPPPTQQLGSSGSIHLTADTPIAIKPIDVQVESGQLVALDFAASLGPLPADGTITAMVEPLEGATPRAPYAATPPPAADPSVLAQAHFPFSCQRSPCAAGYALVVAWNDAPAGSAVDVPWSLSTVAHFTASFTSATPEPGRIAVATGAAQVVPESVELGSAGSGQPVHVTEADRFRAWTVAFHRVDPAAGPVTGPIYQARLSATVTQTTGPAFGAGSAKDRREHGRRDPPVQLRVFAPGDLRAARWASDAALTFDPFVTCPAAGQCDTEMTVELAWADGRPDTAFDASWTVDLAAIGLTGRVEPIEADVVAVPTPDIAAASSTGSFDAGRPTTRGQSTFVASVDPGLDASSPWSRVGLPARAVVTVRVTSAGTTPLPADARIAVYGQGPDYGDGRGTTVEVRPGDEATFAFEPVLTCPGDRPRACEVRGSIGSSLLSPSPNAAPDDIEIRIEWSLQLGVAASTGERLAITVDPGPSARPSLGP